MPQGGVVDWIQTTIRGVPSDSQLEWLREDAWEKAPEDCVFYGWLITGEQSSLSIPDGELESGSFCNPCTSPGRRPRRSLPLSRPSP